MKQSKLEEKSYDSKQSKLEEINNDPIEPGWDYRKEEKSWMQKFEKEYTPIEPKSGFPNPYRVILKHIVKKIEGKKNKYSGALEFFTAGAILPGFMVYAGIKFNDTRKEEGFKPMLFEKEFKNLCFMIEGVKIPAGISIYKLLS